MKKVLKLVYLHLKRSSTDTSDQYNIIITLVQC